METLNRARYLIILKQFASSKYVASVKEVNQLEPVIIGFIPTGKILPFIWPSRLKNELSLNIFIHVGSEEQVCGYRIQLGSSIKAVASRNNFEKQLANYSERNFAVIPDPLTKTIYVIFRQDCTVEDMMESYSQAILSAMLASGNSVSHSSVLQTSFFRRVY